jgi:hypothetical protein
VTPPRHPRLRAHVSLAPPRYACPHTGGERTAKSVVLKY